MAIISKLKQSRASAKNAQRALVLSAARKVLLRDGSFRFSLRAVARELGCSPGAIYNYYADKEELIAASTAAAFTKLGARLSRIKKTADIGDKVRKMGELYVQFGFANPEDYAIAFTVPVAGSRSKPDTPHPIYFLVERVIADAVEAGELFGSPSEIVQVMWMGWHGLVSLMLQRPNFPWAARRRLISAILESVVRSLPTRKPSG
jgi:AcrR family transcriptional regulator